MNDKAVGVALPRGKPLIEVPATLEEWKAKAEALWALLDDIDTYGDMFKPEQTNYFRAVNKKSQGRFAHMESDGYRIINTPSTNLQE